MHQTRAFGRVTALGLGLVVVIATACTSAETATYSCQVWCTSGELQQNLRFDFTATSASDAQDTCFAEKSCTEPGEIIHCAKCQIGSAGGTATNGTSTSGGGGSSSSGGPSQPPRTNTRPVCIGQFCGDPRYSTSCCLGAVCVSIGGGLEGEGATSACRAGNGTACTGNTDCRPESRCTDGKCCPLNGPCKADIGGLCKTHEDCATKRCSNGTCAVYSECAVNPCAQACCREADGFVCKGGKCTWGGGGTSGGGTAACNAPCPDTCDASVPHQACLYCQAACACAYGKTHPAQCCKPGMEAQCQSQLAACESDSRASAASLGTSCP